MALELRQQLKLAQKLVMTPQLRQAIKLLPLTTLELAEVLDQEVMENPLLEEVPVQETLSTEEVTSELPEDLAILNARGYLEDVFFDTDRFDLTLLGEDLRTLHHLFQEDGSLPVRGRGKEVEVLPHGPTHRSGDSDEMV